MKNSVIVHDLTSAWQSAAVAIVVAKGLSTVDSSFHIASASMANAASIAEIYNQGIDSGEATFETKPRSADQVREWFDRKSVVIVAIEASVVVGFAAVFRYRPRDCYRGVGEFSIYMHEDHRGKGQGRRLMRELLESCRNAGYWKLVSRVFPENLACRSLLKGLRFREVGVYERHAQLHGVWRDVIIVEKLL